jgi:hypothetical protein
MTDPKCPGQDQRFWKPQDIFDVICPHCGHEIEFWKDEPVRNCDECKRPVCNPNWTSAARSGANTARNAWANSRICRRHPHDLNHA